MSTADGDDGWDDGPATTPGYYGKAFDEAYLDMWPAMWEVVNFT